MANTLWVNADHGREFHIFADHMTKLHFTSIHLIRTFMQIHCMVEAIETEIMDF